jgi:predicted DCC family thiol-disulfide oxidoreductase YuxK
VPMADRDVVIYDGKCVFCTSQIERLRKWDRGHRLEFLSLHDPEVARRFSHLTHEQLMREMCIVDRHGRVHRGAKAVRYLSRRLPALWWAAPFLHFPGSLSVWSGLYRAIARRRYRLAGAKTCDDDACRIHFGER